VCTGTSGDKEEQGALILIDAESFVQTHKITLSGGGVIRIRWHMKINQICATTSDGRIKVLYDTRKSARGAKFCVAKAPRKANVLDAIGATSFGDAAGTIGAPNTHWKFREEEEQKMMSTSRKRKLDRRDAKKSMLPQAPLPNEGFGLGRQGRVRGGALTLSLHLAKQTSYDRTRDEDPRAAILRHADIAEKDPQFVNKAYEMYGQPTEAILDMDYNSEDDEQESKIRKFDPEKKPFQVRSSNAD
jgi:hypothetical protein